jgi:hypothetical protein
VFESLLKSRRIERIKYRISFFIGVFKCLI